MHTSRRLADTERRAPRRHEPVVAYAATCSRARGPRRVARRHFIGMSAACVQLPSDIRSLVSA